MGLGVIPPPLSPLSAKHRAKRGASRHALALLLKMGPGTLPTFLPYIFRLILNFCRVVPLEVELELSPKFRALPSMQPLAQDRKDMNHDFYFLLVERFCNLLHGFKSLSRSNLEIKYIFPSSTASILYGEISSLIPYTISERYAR